MQVVNKIKYLIFLFSAIACAQKPIVNEIRFIPQGAPTTPNKGYIYVSNVDNGIYYYNGTEWLDLGDSGVASTDDQTAAEVSIADSGGNFTATDVEGALAELYSSYESPLEVSVNGLGSFTVTDANIRSGAKAVRNKLTTSDTLNITLANVNTDEIDILRFTSLNDDARMTITSTNGFEFFTETTANAVRIDGKGAVDFEETSENSGIFEVYRDPNATLILLDTEPPTTPTNLTVTGTTPTTVSLAWDASTDNIGIEAYGIVNFNDSESTIVGDISSYTVTGLTPSTSYTFYVRARDAEYNQSALSNSVVGTTTATQAIIYYKTGNPASGGTNEGTSLTDFTVGNDTAQLASSTSTVFDGTYSLEWTSSGFAFRTVGIALDNISIADEFTITATVQGNAGNLDFRVTDSALADQVAFQRVVGDGTQKTINLSFTANRTDPYLYFVLPDGYTTGQVWYIDNIIFTKTN